MEKYVAFLDILGFKDTLKSLKQCEAEEYIKNFSRVIYNIWNENNYKDVKGYVVSDSVIVYTMNVGEKSLINLIDLLSKMCKEQFKQNNILIRGGLAKGEFEKIEAHELSTLSKGLIVGQAYVDAYLLEGTEKGIGIAISKEVYDDINNVGIIDIENIITFKSNNEDKYMLRFIDINFLENDENLELFVFKAIQSNWLPHYYNTLYFSMIRENNKEVIDNIFKNIINIIKEKSDSNWRVLDAFIENAFNENVNPRFKQRFLRYIRQGLQ